MEFCFQVNWLWFTFRSHKQLDWRNCCFCKGGPGIYDPCEKVQTDAAENLKSQQREEITASAQVNKLLLVISVFTFLLKLFLILQMALRLLAFKQIHKVLGMDSLASLNPRKRQRDLSENDGECKS